MRDSSPMKLDSSLVGQTRVCTLAARKDLSLILVWKTWVPIALEAYGLIF